MNKLSFALSVLTFGVASSFAQGSELSDTGQEHIINQAPKVSGFYIGGTIGTGKFYINRDSGEYTNKDYSDASTLAEKDASSGAQSFQLLAGYQFNRIVAVEMDYTHYINNLNFRGFVWNKTAGSTGFGGYLPEQIHAKPVIYASQANVGYTFANGIRPFVLTGLGFLHLNADKDVYDGNTFNNVLALRIGTGIEYAPVTLQGWALRASWTADYASMDTVREQDNIISTLLSFSYTDEVRLSNFNLGVSYKF